MLTKLLLGLAGYSLLSMIVGSWFQLFDKWPWNQDHTIVIGWWFFHMLLLVASVVGSMMAKENVI